MSLLDAFASLGKNINKLGGKQTLDTEQGIVSEKFPELKLEMENKDLLKLTQQWEGVWNKSDVKQKWETRCDENEKYWLGNHFDRPELDKSRPQIDNAIFEALETYLPRITRRNPEPMVELDQDVDQTPENQKYAKDLQKELAEIADELKLRLKLKKVGRHWAIYLLGAVKYGWDMNKDIPTIKAIRAKKLILDPTCTIDEDGYTGEYIGEYRKIGAGMLIKTLDKIGGEAKASEVIKGLVKEDLGTEIQFIEWWTDEYMCWTLGDNVLLKKKNPHWNYETTTPGESTMDEFGNETPGPETTVEGHNHFEIPKKPFGFLTVFNLGKQPMDDTSLIGQNLAGQDRVNKRIKQIDRNADSMNNGIVVSLSRSGLTQEQAANVTTALRKGGVVSIPDGAPRDAIDRMSAEGLPADIYNDLADTRRRISDIFGTSGMTPQGQNSERTVRGKIMNTNLDTDRIGGGVSEYLEQFADEAFNWMVQLLYVYDDEFASMPDKPDVSVSVKEGSLLPKDSTTIANQAIELASAGKMSTIDLYKKLDYPNPEELAANVWLEVNAPDVLYGSDPRVAQVIQRQQASAANANARPPSESISFKDLPPEGQAQMAKQAGIDLNPEALAAYADAEAVKVADIKAKEIQSNPPVIPQTQ